MKLASIHVYPIKGARGITLGSASVLRGGLRGDRRFMIVKASGEMVTQREHPRLALVTTELIGESLVVGAPGGVRVTLPLAPDGKQRTVRVWNDDVPALEVEGPIGELLSSHLGLACALVFMPDDIVRQVDRRYAKEGDRVGFADAYPLLVATTASLADLNAHLETPLPMSRFRPNLVVEGGEAFEEERHRRVRVGAVELRMPKRCSRCSVTTTDQDTGVVTGKEPLRTLATYRAVDKNVYFAQNAIPDGEGFVAVGDAVTYLD